MNILQKLKHLRDLRYQCKLTGKPPNNKKWEKQDRKNYYFFCSEAANNITEIANKLEEVERWLIYTWRYKTNIPTDEVVLLVLKKLRGELD